MKQIGYKLNSMKLNIINFILIKKSYLTRSQRIKQKGFSLIEIMIVIAIISILSAFAIPGYQGYMQKAAMTDVLQTLLPYKTNIELCGINEGGFTNCNAGTNNIPNNIKGKYIEQINVKDGVITLKANKKLEEVSITLTPQLSASLNVFQWTRVCIAKTNVQLKSICEKTIQF